MFHAALDPDQQPQGTILHFADQGLLLLIASAAGKRVSATCLSRLRRTCIQCGKQEVPLSEHGTASEHLLAGLFLPLDEADASAFIQAMARRGKDALFGQDTCCTRRFDPHLRYQQETYGLQEAAVLPVHHAPVFAPYAAALALPFRPAIAAEALSRFCALGAKGPHGFCDAVDCTGTPALVGLQDSFHQGLILCAAAHLLADAPLRRYFCALPAVEALLPQLHGSGLDTILPALPIRRRAAEPSASSVSHAVDPLLRPAPVHALGTADFHLLADAHGGTACFDHDLPLNQALHFYLADEGRTYRLGDPHLPGEVHFNPGEACLEQLCGSLRCELAVCADTLRRRALHIVTITPSGELVK